MPSLVECHSDYQYAQRPVALLWLGDRKIIEAVLDQWLTPEGRYFRVLTQDQQIFELCFTFASDDWQIHQP